MFRGGNTFGAELDAVEIESSSSSDNGNKSESASRVVSKGKLFFYMEKKSLVGF